jgi:hypothetical protein
MCVKSAHTGCTNGILPLHFEYKIVRPSRVTLLKRQKVEDTDDICILEHQSVESTQARSLKKN